MTKRKSRPEFRTPVVASMSMRDMAAALGTSTAELCRYMRLAEVPPAVFEQRLAESWAAGIKPSAQSLVKPVPARGRVERATALVRSMTAAELAAFMRRLESNTTRTQR